MGGWLKSVVWLTHERVFTEIDSRVTKIVIARVKRKSIGSWFQTPGLLTAGRCVPSYFAVELAIYWYGIHDVFRVVGKARRGAIVA